MANNKAQIVVEAKDQASAVLRGIAGEFGSVSKAASVLSSVTASLGGAGLLLFAQNAIKAAADLDDLSESTGASVEDLSKLEQVAIVSGASMESVAAASVKLSKSLSEADDQGSNAARALKAIGLSAKELKGLDTAEQMRRVAVALSEYANDGTKAVLATALLGKTGAEQLPFLADLAEAGQLNATLTREQAAAAEAYEKQSKRLNVELNRMGKILAVESIPVLTAFKETALGVARSLFDITEESGALSEQKAIQTFAENAGRALAFVGDVAGALRRTIASIADAIVTTAFAAAEVAKGNLATAGALYGDFVDRLQARLMGETVSQAFERNFAKIKASAAATGDAVRKSLNFSLAKPDDAADKAAEKQREAFAQYVEGLDRQLQKAQELSTFETVLADMRSGRLGQLTQQQQELLLRVASEIDQKKDLLELEKEIKKFQDAQRAEQRALDDELERLAGRAEQARKVALTARLEARLAAGEIFTKEELEDLARGIGGIREEIGQTKNVAEELGLVLVSRLGDFFKDPTPKNFFKALAEDVLQFTTKLLILEPLLAQIRGAFGKGGSGSFDVGALFQGKGTDFLGELFGSVAKTFAGGFAGGGLVPAGHWGIVGERGPELAYGGRTGMSVVPASPAGVTNNITINLPPGSNVSRETASQISAAVARQLAVANRRFN